jgi:hypothetical protein
MGDAFLVLTLVFEFDKVGLDNTVIGVKYKRARMLPIKKDSRSTDCFMLL